MNKVFWSSAAIAATMAVSAMAADVALVVQNVRYQNLPINSDIGPAFADYAQAYRDSGFEVIEANDANSEQFRRALIQFEGRARQADRVVIDFTGQIGTHGELMLTKAVDAQDRSVVERYAQSPSLQLFYELVRHRPARAAIVLATPVADIHQLVSTRTRIPQGIVVISGPQRDVRFAVRNRLLSGTSPLALQGGRVGVAGFVTDMPFLATGIATSAPQVPAPQPQTPNSSTVFAEMADWRAAVNTNTEASLNGYLQKYPNGLFVREARARIEDLVPPSQRAERALNLTRTQRRTIQGQLTLLGHNTRGIDGIWGNGTRQAIRRWQAEQGFQVSGYVDAPQLRALASQAERREAEVAAEEAAKKRAAEQADLNYWQETGSGTREDGLRAYLQRYPEGLFAPQATRALAEIDASRPQVNPAFQAQEQALGLTPQMRMLAEQRLQAQGLNPGRVDGNFDANTRAALQRFQQGAGLQVTGYMNRETVSALIVSAFR